MTQLDLVAERHSMIEDMGPNRASGLLDAIQRVAPLIHERRDEFDKLRRLPDDIFETLAAAGVFRLWLPQAIGGPELSPFEFMSIVEAASALDGSVGWLVGNGGGDGERAFVELSGGLVISVARLVGGTFGLRDSVMLLPRGVMQG